jgi:hypothetical protein
MSKIYEASNVSRRQFLAVASSAAAATSFAFGKDVNSTQSSTSVSVAMYPVTINTTKPLSYTTPKLTNASSLHVKRGETVTWSVALKPPYRVVILFFPKSPFIVSAFEGPDSDAAGGKIGGTITGPDGTYPYCVAVFDDAHLVTYTDDPKIIVGDGDDVRAEITAALTDLKDVDADLSDRRKKQDQIRAVERKLERLRSELK